MTVQYIYDYYGGGRRKLDDRRQFIYTYHLPERRSGCERRSGMDRRRAGRELMQQSAPAEHDFGPVLAWAAG